MMETVKRKRIFGQTDDLHRAGMPPNTHFRTVVQFRAPKKGEWYLSGAIPTAYCAKSNLCTAYAIVVPTTAFTDIQYRQGA